MDSTTTETTTEHVETGPDAGMRHGRRSRSRLFLLASSLAALVLVGALGGVAAFWDEAEPEGLVFVIPAGAAERAAHSSTAPGTPPKPR